VARLIVAMCVYNEEQFIDKTIDSLLAKVRDVDVIEILDGAWKNGGETAKSTDDTKDLVELMRIKHQNRCSIIFRAFIIFMNLGKYSTNSSFLIRIVICFTFPAR